MQIVAARTNEQHRPMRLLFLSVVAALSLSWTSAYAQAVDILTPFLTKISIDRAKETFGSADPRLRLYVASKAKPILHAITIPFSVPNPPTGAEISALSLNLYFFTPDLNRDDGVRIISSIPLNVDISSQVTKIAELGLKFSSGKAGPEGKFSSREQFEKLYRTVQVHQTNDPSIRWRFVPAGEQNVLPGIYTVVVLIEASPLTHLAYIDAGCSFRYSWFRSKGRESCDPNNVKLFFQ
jgi:hypothetical protein